MITGQKETKIVLPDLVQVAAIEGKRVMQNAVMSQKAQAAVRQISQQQVAKLARTINLMQPIAVGAVKPIKFGSTASV